MSSTEHNDFGSALLEAYQQATDKETKASEILLGRVAAQAASDQSFRMKLQADPEGVIKQTADKLNIPVGKEEIKQAVGIFSPNPFLPGFNPEKVEKLVFGTIEDVRRSFKLTLMLSQWLFVVGLGMLVTSVLFGVFKGGGHDPGTIVFGAGGTASLIASLIMNPLDRIRNAGANLVQIQMAYLSYYNQLYLLGGTPQHLKPIEAARELRDAATSMVSSIQAILEKAAQAKAGTLQDRRAAHDQPHSGEATPESPPGEPSTQRGHRRTDSGTRKPQPESGSNHA